MKTDAHPARWRAMCAGFAALAVAATMRPATSAAQDDVLPVTLRKEWYPEHAVALKIAAHCRATFDTTPEGVVTNVCASCAAEQLEEEFEEAAARAVTAWRYDPLPGGLKGRETEIEFVLPGDDHAADIRSSATASAPGCGAESDE